MRRVLVTTFAGLALSVGAGCGGSPPCTTCPNITGNWSLTFGTASASSAMCQFAVAMGTPYQFALAQNPPGGSGLTATAYIDNIGTFTLTGTLYANDTASVNETQPSTQTGISGSITETVQIRLNAAANAFTGSWSESYSYTDSTTSPPKTQSCSGTDDITGTFP